MRIGIDIDGVLANFFSAYEHYIIRWTGRDLFPGTWPQREPEVWDWPQTFGYTKDEIKMVWDKIRADTRFYSELQPLPGIAARHVTNRSEHDVYFITDRSGLKAQIETQRWLSDCGFTYPSVLISRHGVGKGTLVAGLELELFIDDKVENILDIQAKAPNCKAYLAPLYPYNRNHPDFKLVKNVRASVIDVLQTENLWTI